MNDALLDLMHGKTLRFVTLTVRSQPTDRLADLIKHVRTSFSKLRTKPVWKQTQLGGAAVLEVKRTNAGTWHPHLHVITHGAFIDVKLIRRTWLEITGDSQNVDVSLVRDNDNAARYIVKYVTKQFGNDVTRHEHLLIEAIDALKGSRLVNTFGDWRVVDPRLETASSFEALVEHRK